MNNQNKYDFVIYGASGFTGKLVVEYALSKYLDANNITWALAGRNLEKLNNLKIDLNIPSHIDILEVDSTNQQSIDNLVSRAKCVLTTVGPYQLYGEKIIRTCILSGTDYVDLCGEPGWMHKIIGECSDDAKKSGSRIIFSCVLDVLLEATKIFVTSLIVL